MKKYVTALSVIFCFSIILVFHQITQANFYVDQSYCADCHKHETRRTHEKHDGGYVDCDKCHNGSPQSGNVLSENCAACHPEYASGKCSLVDDHNNADCLICHFECDSPPSDHIESCITCHVVADLHARLCRVHLLRGHRQSARQHFDKARAADPDLPALDGLKKKLAR